MCDIIDTGRRDANFENPILIDGYSKLKILYISLIFQSTNHFLFVTFMFPSITLKVSFIPGMTLLISSL